MTEQTPKLDVQTLEYIVSMLNADIKSYENWIYIGNYITFLRNKIKILIEEQQEME